MMPVKNQARFCFLCCISSFFADKMIMKSVLQIVCEQPSYCGVGFPNEGVVAEDNYVAFCKELGIHFERLEDNYKPQKSDEKDGSLLIGLKWRCDDKDIRHIVRFDRFKDERSGVIVVMDPDDSEPHTERDSEYFKGKTVIYFRVRLL